MLTRGGRRIAFLEPSLDWPPARLTFVTDSPRLVLDGAKSLSYAGNMVAKRIAQERGFDEALLTTPDGRVMEVQQAAFFWVTPQDEVCTPPLRDGILDSITRRVVMRHLDVVERTCRTEDALGAAEAFLAGAAREVEAVAVVEDASSTLPRGPSPGAPSPPTVPRSSGALGLSAADLWLGR